MQKKPSRIRVHSCHSWLTTSASRLRCVLPWRHRACVDLYTEQRVRLLALVLAVVELRLAIELVGGDVEILVGSDRHAVRPDQARVLRQNLIIGHLRPAAAM